jgi:hypothetical protein
LQDAPVDGRPEQQVDPPDWAFWLLLGAAVLSRLAWVLWVHPPHAHVFSDMAHYVHRAALVASFAVEPGDRMMVWQAWGTHTLLAIPLLLMGPGQSALELAGLMWAAFSAGTVVLGYRLAARVLPGPSSGPAPHWPAIAVGLALLGWVPLLSHTGFFVSETPYTCALLATTLGVVRLLQDGRGALSAGLWGAFAFALRPQSAVFFVLLALAWLALRGCLVTRDEPRRGDRTGGGPATGPPGTGAASRMAAIKTSSEPKANGRHALLLLAPLLVVVAFSMVRVRIHTGHFGGVAENASMNLTAGRCHNIVTRAWSSEADRESAKQTGSPAPDRRISLPGFRALGREGPDHPLALRPALGGEAIDVIGYIGDREVHREIRKRCYAATGVGGQLHYSITNVALLWLVARPWPESSDRGSPQLLPVATRGRQIAAALAPLSLLGMFVALWSFARARADARDPLVGIVVCALQFASLLIVAAVFFGDPRLRVPYDPYAIILVVALIGRIAARLRVRV